jgi:hypothetical protein
VSSGGDVDCLQHIQYAREKSEWEMGMKTRCPYDSPVGNRAFRKEQRV